MSRYVEVSKVEEMLRIIRVSLIVGAGYDIREWLDYVEQMPSVDLVRCKDCEYSKPLNEPAIECTVWADARLKNDFCSAGGTEGA